MVVMTSQMRPDPPGVLVDIGGRNLHAMVAGVGGPVVILESGGGGGSAVQDLPVQRLVSRFTRCICYDRAGLGWSDPALGPRSLDRMADDLHLLLGRLGAAAPVVLVGASFGGLVARAFAHSYPGRVAGMVLVDTADEQKYVATMPAFRAALERELADAARQAAAGGLSDASAASIRASPWLDAAEQRAMLAVLDRPEHFLNSIRELEVLDHAPLANAPPQGLGRLGDTPLIVLRHTRPYDGDYAVWEQGWEDAQRRLAALCTRSALIAVADCGHAISAERPDVVAACVRAVVDRVRGGAFDPGPAEALARA